MPPSASQPPPRAPTLGILADWLEGEYQSAVVAGAMEAAHESGVNLVLLADSIQRATFRSGERHNVVYDLARADAIDGLVVMAGPIGNNLGLDNLARYCERYRPRPMCSIAAPLEGMTGIVVDGEPALRAGIRHLVEDHKYSQIAFIGGPEENLDAGARLRTYREALTAYGLMPPDSFVLAGDYRYEAGVAAVRTLIDERGLSFDALVAASDSIALGAIDALRSRGIRVPREVAIMGFDDIPEARFSAPPLTTIRQPLRRQGRLAVEVLLRRLAGDSVDDVQVLPTELVVRRSCGCNSDARRFSVTGGLPPTRAATELTIDEALKLGRPKILAAMHEVVSGATARVPKGWEERLLDALIAELHGSGPRFAEQIGQLVKEMDPGAEGNPWHPALAVLHRQLLPWLASDRAMCSRAEELLQEAQALVAEAVEDSQIHHRLMIDRRRRSLSEATELLSAAFDLESLATALRKSMPRLGVPSAYLVLDEGVSSVGVRMLFAYDPRRDPVALERLCEAAIEGTSMPDGLLPADRTYTMVVEPLFFKDDPLGYAVFEMGPKDTFTYEAFGALRVRISGALKVALLVEELQVRVGELRQAQKMETLGQLSGAIAHDFNNLLQAIRGYAELAGTAEPGSAQQSADLEEIVRASDRASQLTRQLLTFSQPTRANARVVNVNECVGETIPLIKRLLGPAIDVSAVLGPDAGNIVIDPTQLEQAIVNLCVNSRDAMPEGGSVTIETGRRSAAPGTSALHPDRGLLHADRGAPHPSGPPMTYVAVRDTGMGISPGIKDRIFEPFFTTKETGQGTGLGLSIVYGIVRSASGDIVVESEPGHGTRFFLMFPTSEAAEEASMTGLELPVRGTETVLLVEDEDAIRKLAERVLLEAGYRVLSAANALEARELWAVHEGSVDLLLSDVTMPGLSGMAFATELATSARPPRTLLISGRLPGERGGPTLPNGAAFLQKPFGVAALLDAVRATLDSPPAT